MESEYLHFDWRGLFSKTFGLYAYFIEFEVLSKIGNQIQKSLLKGIGFSFLKWCHTHNQFSGLAARAIIIGWENVDTVVVAAAVVVEESIPIVQGLILG